MAKSIDFADDIDDKGEVDAVRQSEKDDPNKDPVVDLDKVEAEEEEKAARKESRTSRYWRNKEDADRDRERIAALERREQELLNQQAIFLQQQQQSFQTRQEPQRDPIDDEVNHLMRRADLIRSEYTVKQQQYGGRVPPEVHERMERELKEVELAVVDKRAEKIIRDRLPQQNQGNPQAAAIRAHVEMNYPDVHRNPNAIQYAQHWEMLEISKGNRPTLDQVMDAARRQFRSGPYAAGAPRPRAEHLADRYAGVPRGASGGASEGSRTVVMTKELKRMANTRFSHIQDEKKRHEAFAKMLAEEEGKG